MSSSGSLADRVEAFLREGSPVKVGLVIALLVVARAGFDLYGKIGPLVDFARDFPVSSGSYKAEAVWLAFAAHALGVRSPAGWQALLASLTALSTFVAAWLILRAQRDSASRRLVALTLAFSSVPVCALQLIGHYDVATLLSGLMLGLGTAPSIAALGGLLVGGNHPSQGAILLLSYCLTAAALQCFRLSLAALFALGLLVGSTLAGYVRVEDAAGGTRMDLFIPNLARSVDGFVRLGTVGIWSWFGACWPLVLFALAQAWPAGSFWGSGGARFLLLLGGLVLVPAAVTVTTMDGTRVFVCCSTPSLCLVLRHLAASPGLQSSIGAKRHSWSAFVLFAAITPAYVTWAGGEVRKPWANVASRLDLVPVKKRAPKKDIVQQGHTGRLVGES